MTDSKRQTHWFTIEYEIHSYGGICGGGTSYAFEPIEAQTREEAVVLLEKRLAQLRRTEQKSRKVMFYNDPDYVTGIDVREFRDGWSRYVDPQGVCGVENQVKP